MKTRLKHCLLAIAAILILCGCNGEYVKEVTSKRVDDRLNHLIVDTIEVHGNKHEIIRDYAPYKGGIMHSPECWCKKGGER